MIKSATAFAPATVANVAVGFDILGFAVRGIGEIAEVQRIEGTTEVVLNSIKGYPDLPIEPDRNTATAGLLHLIRDKKLKFGFQVTLTKSIPIGSGLGGSSLSAVATIVAANALLKKKLTKSELLHYALIGEKVASGAIHADNVGPCLEGGLVYVRTEPSLWISKIKTPASLRCVLLLPELSINTKGARQLLKPEVPLETAVQQTSNLAGFILGCTQNNYELMRASLKDVMIEHQRAGLIPYFSSIQEAAVNAGALGCSISGSGPAIFALAANQKTAEKIKKAMLKMAKVGDLSIRGSWITPIASKGAYVTRTRK